MESLFHYLLIAKLAMRAAGESILSRGGSVMELHLQVYSSLVASRAEGATHCHLEAHGQKKGGLRFLQDAGHSGQNSISG